MIVTIHHYKLGESSTPDDFRAAAREAERQDLFDLPGLKKYQFLRGIKGARKEGFTAVWTYESRQAWRDLWGTVDDPKPKEEYPDKWVVWEDGLLSSVIDEAPDKIEYTSYEILDI